MALTIAGSDCSGGAGIQADLKTFSSRGVYGLTAVTCVVSEVPGHVSLIQAVTPDVIADQIRLLLAGFPVAAVKTGMLYDAEIVRIVAEALRAMPAAERPALVVDPVMVATSGDPLITPGAVAAYQELLFPLARVITPNMDEAGVLLGRKLTTEADLKDAAAELRARHGCAVLLKGGHLGGDEAVDILLDERKNALRLTAPFVRGFSTHGTGCTYSAAIAAELAKGRELRAAVRAAKKYITASITRGFRWPQPPVDALNHFLHRAP